MKSAACRLTRQSVTEKKSSTLIDNQLLKVLLAQLAKDLATRTGYIQCLFNKVGEIINLIGVWLGKVAFTERGFGNNEMKSFRTS